MESAYSTNMILKNSMPEKKPLGSNQFLKYYTWYPLIDLSPYRRACRSLTNSALIRTYWPLLFLAFSTFYHWSLFFSLKHLLTFIKLGLHQTCLGNAALSIVCMVDAGCFLQRHIFQPHPRLTESESLEVEPRNINFHSSLVYWSW